MRLSLRASASLRVIVCSYSARAARQSHEGGHEYRMLPEITQGTFARSYAFQKLSMSDVTNFTDLGSRLRFV